MTVSPLTTCVLVAAICCGLVGWGAAALVVCAFALVFEFFLPALTQPQQSSVRVAPDGTDEDTYTL